MLLKTKIGKKAVSPVILPQTPKGALNRVVLYPIKEQL